MYFFHSSRRRLSAPTRATARATARAATRGVILAALFAFVLPPAPSAIADASAVLSDIDTARAHLEAGDYAAADEVTAALLADLAPQVTATGAAASYLVGTLHTLHALALSGQGDERGARWHWYFAQSVWPRVARVSLAPYGEAGAWLEPYRIVDGEGEEKCYYGPGESAERYYTDGRPYDQPVPERSGKEAQIAPRSVEHGGPFGTVARDGGAVEEGAGTGDAGDGAGEDGVGGNRDGSAADRVVLPPDPPLGEVRDALGQGRSVRVIGAAGVRPPVKIHAPFPAYTVPMREAGIQGTVVLATIIDREGLVHNPCVLRSPAPGLAHQAAQAVKGWRFEPATHFGEPVDVFYNLTINFTLD